MANTKDFTMLTNEELTTISGGWGGYYWNCRDGYRSHWHMFRDTAEENARQHERVYNTVCGVFNA